MIAQLKGYPLKIVLPENVSIERRQMLEVFGAEIIPSPGEEGSNGAVRRAQALAAEHPEWVFLYQYGNEANPRAHYRTHRPRDLARLPRDHPLRGRARHAAARCWASGTYLKEQNPDVQDLRGRAAGRRAGRGAAEPRRRLHPAGVREVGRPRAARRQDASCGRASRSSGPAAWCREAGVFAGISSGAALAGAAKVARKIDDGHDRVRRLRRRLEVPVHRRLHRRPRRGREANAEKIIYF